MTEEIIIDGVNVAGCMYYLFRDKEPTSDRTCGIGLTTCVGKECDYKTILRLKQENDTIREHCKQVDETNKILYKEKCDLIQENEELKKQIQAQKGLITVGGKQQYEMTLAYDKCKKALEEINNICNETAGMYTNRKIQSLINEVLDNESKQN